MEWCSSINKPDMSSMRRSLSRVTPWLLISSSLGFSGCAVDALDDTREVQQQIINGDKFGSGPND
jgi:hypothetical protein